MLGTYLTCILQAAVIVLQYRIMKWRNIACVDHQSCYTLYYKLVLFHCSSLISPPPPMHQLVTGPYQLQTDKFMFFFHVCVYLTHFFLKSHYRYLYFSFCLLYHSCVSHVSLPLPLSPSLLSLPPLPSPPFPPSPLSPCLPTYLLPSLSPTPLSLSLPLSLIFSVLIFTQMLWNTLLCKCRT